MRARSIALLVLAAALAACAGTAPSVRRPDATVAVDCPVPGARVYVDERFAGRAAELSAHPLPVVSGPLRIEVRADGYFTAYRDLDVHPSEAARLSVALDPIPAGESGE